MTLLAHVTNDRAFVVSILDPLIVWDARNVSVTQPIRIRSKIGLMCFALLNHIRRSVGSGHLQDHRTDVKLEIAEMCARSGANCGSLFLDLRFRELVRTLLADHPAHLDAPSLAYFMHNFSETDKLAYMGEVDDGELSWAIRLHSRLFWVFFSLLALEH
jgi:hypothetical protein